MKHIYPRKKDLPLDVYVPGFKLRLDYVAPRCRKPLLVSFTGITREEAISEAKLFLCNNRGRFVDNGQWTNYFVECEIKKIESNGEVIYWQQAPFFSDIIGLTLEEKQTVFKQ